ncbi:MAG: YfiR family protein [Bacteroidales bacterium]|nr:YfiR family protein [Bacteroidales bacterium]
MKKFLIISILSGISLCIASAQNERFKSLYVFNFVKNIEWPASYQKSNFTIAVLGNSLIYNELKQNIQGKTTGQNGSQVIDVNQVSNISSLKDCHILYIPMQQSNLLGAAKKALAGKPTVIITEKKGLITEGADINLISLDGKLRYELAPKQIESKRLKVNKKLIELAIVYDYAAAREVPVLESVDDANAPR